MSFKFDWARKRKSGSTNSDATSTTNDGTAIASEPPPLLSPHRQSSLTYAAYGDGTDGGRGGEKSGFRKTTGSFSFLHKDFWRPSKKSRGSVDKQDVQHPDGGYGNTYRGGGYSEHYPEGYGGYGGGYGRYDGSYSYDYSGYVLGGDGGGGNYGHAAFSAAEPSAMAPPQPSQQQAGGGVYVKPEPEPADALSYDFASEEDMRRHHDKLNAFTFKFGRTRPRRASDLYGISPNNSYRAIYDGD